MSERWVDPARHNKEELPDKFDFDLITCPLCMGKGIGTYTIVVPGLGSADAILPCFTCGGAGMVAKANYEQIKRRLGIE